MKTRDKLMAGDTDTDVTSTSVMFRMTGGAEIKDDREWSREHDRAYGGSRHPDGRKFSAVLRQWDKEMGY
jgi:hypothetical protein